MVRDSAPQCRIGILGNKVDLSERAVTYEEGEAKTHNLQAKFDLETSALTGQNVETAFQRIGERATASRRS
jgi:hypothetical protein